VNGTGHDDAPGRSLAVPAWVAVLGILALISGLIPQRRRKVRVEE